MDLDQIIIKGRLILTVQIFLNPAHQDAIEEDLNALAASLGVDIAAVFSTSTTPQTKPDTSILKLSSAKLHPKHLMQITGKLFEAGANIEDLSRTGTDPLEVTIKISGAAEKQVQAVLATIDAGLDFSLTSGV
jgi:phosphoserine phosphatase